MNLSRENKNKFSTYISDVNCHTFTCRQMSWNENGQFKGYIFESLTTCSARNNALWVPHTVAILLLKYVHCLR